MAKYLFVKSDDSLILKHKGCELRIVKDDKYTTCFIKDTKLGENSFSAFPSDSLNYVVKTTLRDFVYMRKGNPFFEELYDYMYEGGIVAFEGEELTDDDLLIPVDNLKLSSRPLNALKKNRIYTLDDIPKTKQSLLKLESMGNKSADEILEVLGRIGLTNKPKPVSRTNIKSTRIPKNIQNILVENGISYLEEVPKDVKILLKMKGMGRVKINKLLASI